MRKDVSTKAAENSLMRTAKGEKMPKKSILVVGAGGHFGRYIAPELLKRGAKVRAMVHHDQAAAVARSTGVTDIARADLRDEAAVRRALDGVGGVFYIPPKFLSDEAALGVRLVELAAEAGVERFVLSGVMYPFITDMCNHREKLPVELALIKSGLAFTILHPTNLMQSTGVFFWSKVLDTGE
ncbi:MAG: NmrA family NAD(P)-binding protein, partial [Sphingobium sp.]